jgi:hypothetical protein
MGELCAPNSVNFSRLKKGNLKQLAIENEPHPELVGLFSLIHTNPPIYANWHTYPQFQEFYHLITMC